MNLNKTGSSDKPVEISGVSKKISGVSKRISGVSKGISRGISGVSEKEIRGQSGDILVRGC